MASLMNQKIEMTKIQIQMMDAAVTALLKTIINAQGLHQFELLISKKQNQKEQ